MRANGIRLRYIELLFKIDSESRICLLWCRSLRGILASNASDKISFSTCLQCHKSVDMSLKLHKDANISTNTRQSEEAQEDDFWRDLVERFGYSGGRVAGNHQTKIPSNNNSMSGKVAFLSPLATQQLELLKKLATTKFGRSFEAEKKNKALALRSRLRRKHRDQVVSALVEKRVEERKQKELRQRSRRGGKNSDSPMRPLSARMPWRPDEEKIRPASELAYVSRSARKADSDVSTGESDSDSAQEEGESIGKRASAMLP